MTTTQQAHADAERALPVLEWTRARYERAVEAGVFTPGDKVELLDGVIFSMSAQNTPHAVAVRLALRALLRVFGEGFDVTCQLPFALDDRSEPEPDLAVVSGKPRDYLEAHPSEAVLIVEVADSTLEFDRTRKLAAYARNGVPEYWIINLSDRCLEGYLDPDATADKYREARVFKPGQAVAPTAAAKQKIAIDDLLP